MSKGAINHALGPRLVNVAVFAPPDFNEFLAFDTRHLR